MLHDSQKQKNKKRYQEICCEKVLCKEIKMSKYFLYIDETKQLQNGILILWGFLSRYNKESCNKIIEKHLATYKLWNYKELKSTSKYGKEFIEHGWVEFLQQKWIIEKVIWTITFEYYRDSYEWYRSVLIKLIEEINIKDDLIGIYIDSLPVVKNTKILQKYLERDICPIFPNITKIIPENSSNQRCIQLADHIIGEIRKYYLYREDLSFESLFPTVSKKITTKKSPSGYFIVCPTGTGSIT